MLKKQKQKRLTNVSKTVLYSWSVYVNYSKFGDSINYQVFNIVLTSMLQNFNNIIKVIRHQKTESP